MDAAGDVLSESLGAVAPELLAQLAAEERGGRPEFLRLTILHIQRRSNLSLRQRQFHARILQRTVVSLRFFLFYWFKSCYKPVKAPVYYGYYGLRSRDDNARGAVHSHGA